MCKINGLVHTKNILPKHRTQSRFRPVLRQKRGVQAIGIIITILTNGRRSRMNFTGRSWIR